MRDPERIDKFLIELGKYWKKVPDWRFGQFISNVFSASSRDPFFFEEEDFLELLEKYFERKNV